MLELKKIMNSQSLEMRVARKMLTQYDSETIIETDKTYNI